jgi:hypothetical protein
VTSVKINPKPKPPMPGGEYTHISDPGTPPLPPGIKVVGLIPVGDGRPGPLLPRVTNPKRRNPLLPSYKEVELLPRWARVAFAARCARRVLPIIRGASSLTPGDSFGAVAAAVDAAERCAATADRTIPDRVFAPAEANLDYFGSHASDAVCVAATTVSDTLEAPTTADAIANATNAADSATRAILLTSSEPRDLVFVRKDFDRLLGLAKEHGWTDDTPVPPEVFGPLWPPGRVPRWARETKKPRE